MTILQNNGSIIRGGKIPDLAAEQAQQAQLAQLAEQGELAQLEQVQVQVLEAC